jgi:predicted RNase H-like HicB family nuclease
MQVVALIDEDKGRFGVTFPDFPGCTTIGKTFEEAVGKAAEVLAFHVEGLAEDGALPEPRTLEQLRGDRQFRRDEKTAVPALIPYEPPSKATRINITIDEGLLRRIDAAAENAGETRSAFLAAAARRRMMAGV